MVIQRKPYNNGYSVGIYVDGWWGGNGMPPHIFIGLKNEKIKLSQHQITMFKQMFQRYKDSGSFTKNAENFIQPATQYQLTQTLSKKDIDKAENKQAWLNGKNDKDYVEKRVEFDRDFAFFRICQTDITLNFKKFLETLKVQPNTYDEIVKYVDMYAQTHKEYVLNIEGFFGFGPYVSSTKKMADEKFKGQAKNESGGKVYQNNQYDHKSFDNKDYKKQLVPKIPQDEQDRKSFVCSEGHILGSIRPLDTFSTNQTVVFDIHQDLFFEVAKKILLDTIISDDSFRTKECFFDEKNIFKDYRVIKNSCVDFVQDKMEIAQIIIDNKISPTPDKLLHRLKKIDSKQDSKARVELLLHDLHLFYQNYATLCSIDSAWECEKGLMAFSTYYHGILYSNLLQDTKLNRLGIHKIEPLPRDNAIENIADDIAMRINTGLCVNAYFQDMLQYKSNLECDVALLCVKELNGKQRFYKADSQSDFIYQDFDFANNDKAVSESYALAMDMQQPIIFGKIAHHNVYHISKESKGAYIQSFLERYAGQDRSIGDYRDILKSKETRNA